jgi:hypothetical protein
MWISFAVARGRHLCDGGQGLRRHQGSQERNFIDTRIRHRRASAGSVGTHAIPRVLPSFRALPMPRIGCPPRAKPPPLAAWIVAVDLTSVARHADVEGAPAVAAPEIHEILAQAVHPLA